MISMSSALVSYSSRFSLETCVYNCFSFGAPKQTKLRVSRRRSYACDSDITRFDRGCRNNLTGVAAA
jgi:hypothetical protein